MNDSLAERGARGGHGRRRFLGRALAGPLLIAGCSTTAKKPMLSGTRLNGSEAPDFSLTGQNGASVSVSELRGTAVALSFVFTTCPDICPRITSQTRAAWDLLPAAPQNDAAFPGVTADPERDIPEALRTLSKRVELDAVPGWHALSGTRPALEAVSAAYGLDGTKTAAEIDSHTNGSTGVTKIRHTDAAYLIANAGKQQALVRSYVDRRGFANDLKVLTT